jgi:hypothetical protein
MINKNDRLLFIIIIKWTCKNDIRVAGAGSRHLEIMNATSTLPCSMVSSNNFINFVPCAVLSWPAYPVHRETRHAPSARTHVVVLAVDEDPAGHPSVRLSAGYRSDRIDYHRRRRGIIFFCTVKIDPTLRSSGARVCSRHAIKRGQDQESSKHVMFTRQSFVALGRYCSQQVR